MRADGATDSVVAMNDLEQPVEAGLAQQLGDTVRCQRCQFRGLQDEGVARRQRRRRLPAGNLDRIVPGPDAGADTQRNALAIGDGIGIAPHVASVRLCQRREEIHRIAPLGASADTASPYTLPTSRTSILASSSLCAKQLRGACQNLRPVMPASQRPFLLRHRGDLDGAVKNRSSAGSILAITSPVAG